MNLWLSLHRLVNVPDALSVQSPAELASALPEPSSPWPSPKMPQNQIAYQEWLLTDASIFQCESLPDSPIFTLDAPAVKGLVIYGAKCGTTRFHAAWTAAGGTFVGWMRLQPQVVGVESDYAVGEVLGRPLFMGIILDLSGHDAIDRFLMALRNAAWDLGVAGG